MTPSGNSILKKLLLVFLILAGLYFAENFLMPLSIAGLLSMLFLPFCKWMERKKIPKGLAAFFCILTLVLIFAFLGGLVGWLISELMNDLPYIQQKATETGIRIQQYLSKHFGIRAETQYQWLKDQENVLSKMIQSIAGSMLSLLTNFILILVYIFFLLYYRSHIHQFILKLSAPSQKEEMREVIYSVTNVSQQYLLGLAKMIFCLWIMYGIGFSVLGVKNALFFAILCGLLEIVPYIGNLTGTALTLLVAAAQGASASMLGGILVTYGIIQFFQGWVLETIIVGPQVKINPLFTIIALVLGELIWGIPGIFLAIPLTAMLKIVCLHIEPLKPYGFLMGEITQSKTEISLTKKIKKWYNKS